MFPVRPQAGDGARCERIETPTRSASSTMPPTSGSSMTSSTSCNMPIRRTEFIFRPPGYVGSTEPLDRLFLAVCERRRTRYTSAE